MRRETLHTGRELMVTRELYEINSISPRRRIFATLTTAKCDFSSTQLFRKQREKEICHVALTLLHVTFAPYRKRLRPCIIHGAATIQQSPLTFIMQLAFSPLLSIMRGTLCYIVYVFLRDSGSCRDMRCSIKIVQIIHCNFRYYVAGICISQFPAALLEKSKDFHVATRRSCMTCNSKATSSYVINW
jgi:hypothetical protein